MDGRRHLNWALKWPKLVLSWLLKRYIKKLTYFKKLSVVHVIKSCAAVIESVAFVAGGFVCDERQSCVWEMPPAKIDPSLLQLICFELYLQ